MANEDETVDARGSEGPHPGSEEEVVQEGTEVTRETIQTGVLPSRSSEHLE